jgi:hypothetical protein
MKVMANNSGSYKCIFGQVLLVGIIAQLLDLILGLDNFKPFYFLGCGLAVWGYFIGMFIKKFMGIESYKNWLNDYNQRMLDIAAAVFGNIILCLLLQWLFISVEPQSALLGYEVSNV